MISLMNVSTTAEFDQWYLDQEARIRTLIDARITKIKEHNHLGKWRYLGSGLAELKWENGTRVYFAKIAVLEILLIWGGFKNAQKKDIKKAKNILQRYAYTSIKT